MAPAAPWYRFENAAAASRTADIHILDFIGGWGDDFFNDDALTAKSFLADLAKLADTIRTIRLHVNSPGGDVFAAVNIANALRDQRLSKQRTVDVIIEGLAASAASVVIMAGNTIRMADNALVMVHNPYTGVMGDAQTMREVADRLDKIRGTIIATYQWRSSLSAQKIGALMDATTWMDADQAISNGFATEKIAGLKAAASVRPDRLAKLSIPEPYRARLFAAALGTANASHGHYPGSTGQSPDRLMNTQERITDLRSKLQTAGDRMNALMAIREDDGLDWTAEQSSEYDTLAASTTSLGQDLARYEALERTQGAMASAVTIPAVRGATARHSIGNPRLPELPKGYRMGRYALALFAAEGDRRKAAQIADKHWGKSSPDVVQALNAAADLGVTTNDPWGGELTPYQVLASEFVELIRAQTILGRINGLRRVPFNIKFPVQTAGTVGSWVGEGGLKPVGKLDLDNATLRFTKVAKIVAFSEEMQRFSNPGTEQLVRDDLVAGVAETIDKTFIDPTIIEIADVRPASITNGAPNDAASGTDADAIREDLREALASFASDNIPVNGLVWIMTPDIAATLSLAVNSFSQPIFPTLTPEGGSLLGYQVIVSGNVPSATVVLLKPSEIFLADDGGVNIDISRQATLVMDDGASPSVTTTMNLWQQNAVGIRAERFINWKRRRDKAVYYITNAVYHS